MGVKNLSELFNLGKIKIKKNTEIPDYKEKYLAFDAFNVLFQFLASIRDRQGNSLQDKEGRVTSHLVGILTRNCNLLQEGVKPVYVFDGKSHPLKDQVKKARRKLTEIAEEEYEKALKDGDMIRARSFAQRMNKLTGSMIDDSKTLLKAMGIPVIQAPGEGEAQAAQLTREGKAYATASQDFDALMFGSPIMVRNLNFTGKRTYRGRVITINPEEIALENVLKGLDLTHEQLVDLGILLGSDFNPDGIKGVGPKTAYKFIQKYGSFLEIRKTEEKVKGASLDYDVIKGIFLEPNVEKKISIDKTQIFDIDSILDFLVTNRGFDADRYTNLLKKTERMIEERHEQTNLADWF